MAELLRTWKTSLVDETGEALQSALEFVRRARIHEAKEPLSNLIHQRALTLPVGEYSDLHGRALEALAAIDRDLDLLACWKEELSSEDYVPLVFSLVRDHHPEHLKNLMPDVARLGFLREALRTVVVRYPERGLDIVLDCARFAYNRGDLVLLEEFWAALPMLGLKTYEVDDVSMMLMGVVPPGRSTEGYSLGYVHSHAKKPTAQARSAAPPSPQTLAALPGVSLMPGTP